MNYKRYICFVYLIITSTNIIFAIGMPVSTFKNVGSCFKANTKLYAPMFGSIALSSGLIENLRFYNVIPATYNEATGDRAYKDDRVPQDDHIMEIIKILFPSTTGKLTAESIAPSNFGKKCTITDIATLLNLSYFIRQHLKKDTKLPKDIINTLPQKSDTIKQNIKNLKNKNEKKTINKLLASIVLALQKEHEKEFSKKNTDPEEGIEDFQSLYPAYMVEQVLLAFFCHKFSYQNDLKDLLMNLDDNIVDKKKVDTIEGNITKQDIDTAIEEIQNGNVTIDNLWIALNEHYFLQMLPYKNNQNPLSNGITKMYDRTENRLIADKTFADCVEISIRHIMNFIFYDQNEKKFSLDTMLAYMEEKNKSYLNNLIDFYNEQNPDLANAGSTSLRSKWNTVVADLGSNILYLQSSDTENKKPNNEIKSGMLNLVRVFETIFNLNLGPEPIYEKNKVDDFKAAVTARVENCLHILFQELSPTQCICETTYEHEELLSLKNDYYDVTGDITVTIKSFNDDPESSEKLFSFVIHIEKFHTDIEKIEINEPAKKTQQLPLNIIADNLNALTKTLYQSSFFLADKLRFFDKNVPFLYQALGKNIDDSTTKIESLSVLHDWFYDVDTSIIIENILASLPFSDGFISSQLSKHIFSQWHNPSFLAVIKNNLVTLNLVESNITKLELSKDFNKLQKATINKCIKLKKVDGSSPSLTHLLLSGSHIKTLDISNFSNLTHMSIDKCSIQSIEPSQHLKTLYIQYPFKEDLDLSLFSALEHLQIDRCKTIKSFGTSESITQVTLINFTDTSIDVSGFSRLKTLELESCLHLTSFGSSDSISKVIIQNSPLKKIDLSQLKSLKTVFINGTTPFFEIVRLLTTEPINEANPIFEIDPQTTFQEDATYESFGTSNSLEEIHLKNLQNTTLDLSGFPALKKINITDCNQLTKIYVSDKIPTKEKRLLQKQYPGKVITVNTEYPRKSKAINTKLYKFYYSDTMRDSNESSPN